MRSLAGGGASPEKCITHTDVCQTFQGIFWDVPLVLIKTKYLLSEKTTWATVFYFRMLLTEKRQARNFIGQWKSRGKH